MLNKITIIILSTITVNIGATTLFKTDVKDFKIVDSENYTYIGLENADWSLQSKTLIASIPEITNQTTSFIQNKTYSVIEQRGLVEVYRNPEGLLKKIPKEIETRERTEIEDININVSSTESKVNELYNCIEEGDVYIEDNKYYKNATCDQDYSVVYTYTAEGINEQKNGSNITKKETTKIEKTKPNTYASCEEAKLWNPTTSGNYTINVSGTNKNIYCEMNLHGGGWSRIARIQENRNQNFHDILNDQGLSYTKILLISENNQYFHLNTGQQYGYWYTYGFGFDRTLIAFDGNNAWHHLPITNTAERPCGNGNALPVIPSGNIQVLSSFPSNQCYNAWNQRSYCAKEMIITKPAGKNRISAIGEHESNYGCNADNYYQRNYTVYVK